MLLDYRRLWLVSPLNNNGTCLYAVSQRNQDILLVSITSRNSNRLSNLCTARLKTKLQNLLPNVKYISHHGRGSNVVSKNWEANYWLLRGIAVFQIVISEWKRQLDGPWKSSMWRCLSARSSVSLDNIPINVARLRIARLSTKFPTKC